MALNFKQLCDGVRSLGTAGQFVSSDGTDFEWVTPDGARVYNSTSQAKPSTTLAAITFDSERYDHGGLHSTTSNPSRLTAQRDGTYLITGTILWDSNTTGLRVLLINLNGGDAIASQETNPDAAGYAAIALSTIFHLAAGDYVELKVYQTSGGDLLVLQSEKRSPEFAMQWLGP